MQHIKIIKILKLKNFQRIIFCLVIIFISLFIYRSVLYSKTVPTFSSRGQIDILENVKTFDNGFFEYIFSQSIPAYKVLSEKMQMGKESENRGPNFIARSVLKLALNIDSFTGKDIIAYQIPLFGQIRLETSYTPGVELEPDKQEKEEAIEQIPENEHEPENTNNSENIEPPEVEPKQIEEVVPAKGAPIVLIYHTHTTESYMPSKGYNYKPRDKAYHSNDLNYTVVSVGEVLAKELEKYGIKALHNKTVHDVPTYMYSYSNSLNTVQELLKKYPTLQVLIDLHRDAPYSDPNKSRELTTVKINGKLYSRIMLVVGTDKMFPHPYWKENYKFALLIQEKMEELFPGLSRDIDLREQRFNQHLSKKAILVEIGSHGNTMEESIESAKAFAKVLSEVIKSISKKT